MSGREEDDDRVIVIGSGPCGAMAADRLLGAGERVLLLEAGLGVPRGLLVRAAGNTVVRWVDRRGMSNDRHDPATTPGVEWYSSHSLGGLSNYWTGAVPRFAPEDFGDGARLDERYEWPLSYDELVPHYERAERLLTVTAGNAIPGIPENRLSYHHAAPRDWQDVIERSNAAGHGMGVMPLAKGRPWMIARRGQEFNSYHCILARHVDNPRLEVRTGARVVRLVYSPGPGRVESVEYADRRSNDRVVVRGRAVLLAAGTVDTTTLLLRSTSKDFPTGLGNSSALIGKYLHDHPREWWVAEPSRVLSALSHPLYIARPAFDAAASPLMATSLTLGLATRSHRLRTYHRGRVQAFGVQVFGTMVPTPDVGISLGAESERLENDRRPVIHLRYDDAVVKNLTDARQRLADVFADAGVSVNLPGPFHGLHPGSSVHFGGTVRMHRSPEFGALDEWNRLRDVPNVVVCDASCFPTGPEKNPTLTAMAVAARAAENLASER